jgi:hypothetical protein
MKNSLEFLIENYNNHYNTKDSQMEIDYEEKRELDFIDEIIDRANPGHCLMSSQVFSLALYIIRENKALKARIRYLEDKTEDAD